MTLIHPFRAIRPTRDKAELVSTRPMYAYRAHILKAKLDENPYTFLHIIHPFDEQSKQIVEREELYHAVTHSFENFLTENILFQDEKAHFYIYRQTSNGKTCTGIIAGASIDEYLEGKIKKHEETITKREGLFTNYLRHTGFNAEPVLLTHKDDNQIKNILSELTQCRPEYEFSTTDKIKHELWVVQEEKTQEIQEKYLSIEELYIADGHHRSASSSKLYEELDLNEVKENSKFFLAYFIPESDVTILEFNRLVKHLNGHSISSFIAEIDNYFHVEMLSGLRKPLDPNEIVCYLAHGTYSLRLKEEFQTKASAVSKLSAQILTDFILDPILGFDDLKNSTDIEFVPGTKDLEHYTHLIDSDLFKVAFLLHPLSPKDIREVADEKGVMPPKSTYIEPKLRSGLTSYRIFE